MRRVIGALLVCALAPACYLGHERPAEASCGDDWSGRYEVWSDDEVFEIDIAFGAPRLRCEIDGSDAGCFTGHGTIWIDLPEGDTLVAELVSCADGDVPAVLQRPRGEVPVRMRRLAE